MSNTQKYEAIIAKITELISEVKALHDAAEKDYKKDQTTPLWTSVRKLGRIRQIFEVDLLKRPKVKRQALEHEVERGQGTREMHESYGSISVSRIQGSKRLVAAMADNLPNYIELKVNRASRIINHDTHTEYYFADYKEPLITIQMSVYQWAELITSLNTTGIPCTVDTVQGVQMDKVPAEVTTPLEQITQESKLGLDPNEIEITYQAKINELIAQVEAAGLSKKKTDEITKTAIKLRELVNVPKESAKWATRRFSEMTESAISQARVEIAASLQSLILKAGVKGLENHLTTLELTTGSEDPTT